MNICYEINSIPKLLLNEPDNEFREKVCFKKLVLFLASVASNTAFIDYSELLKEAEKPTEANIKPSKDEAD